jgi:hypothetical protein
LRARIARNDRPARQQGDANLSVKLRASDQLEMPNELKDVQYARLAEYKSADALVEWVVSNIRS